MFTWGTLLTGGAEDSRKSSPSRGPANSRAIGRPGIRGSAPHCTITLPAIAERVPDEASAYEFLEELRWDGRPVCPHCGSVRPPYFLSAKNGGRKTRTGSISARRVWKCADCRKQFSVLTGTIFQGTKISIRTWLFVVFEMCASKNGVAAREIERKYDLSPKSAWFMTQRIREAMKRGHGRSTVVLASDRR